MSSRCQTTMNTLLILTFCCFYAYAAVETQKWSNEGEDTETRIIGGQNARRHQFPYMASIQNAVTRAHWCGASIISTSWLVSAAYCFYRLEASWVAVAGLLVQGENHPDIQAISVETIIVHPEYMYNFNDIALLKVQYPFEFNHAVQPVSFPKADAVVSGNVVLTGWGAVTIDPWVPATSLQYLEMNLINNTDCNLLLANSPTEFAYYPWLIRKSMVCALPSEKDESGCYGDSGSPLVQNGSLIGVMQKSSWKCTPAPDIIYPGIFTRTSSFTDFITENIKE